MPAEWKRAVTVAGHRTSVSLDPMIWDLLGIWARARRVSRNGLITEIDGQRGDGAWVASLSSTIRTGVLEAVRAGIIESGPQAGS